ncbi:MAG: AAA family ATPase [bacterium]|nr:AAA family ATPase [bacterium]
MVHGVCKGKYFTINRPRQYGKTTCLFLLQKELEHLDCLVAKISFEGVGDSMFSSEERFVRGFLRMIRLKLPDIFSSFLSGKETESISLQDLSENITEIIKIAGKHVVLAIDEVDKSSGNQLFLSFLGMLRDKYLSRVEGTDLTFHSVILAGVHDVKNLKLKISPDEEQKYNSPWNIAVDFKVDLCLDIHEIESMLQDFLSVRPGCLPLKETAAKLLHLTSGHPFLVSRLCKIIDEELKPGQRWTTHDMDAAVNILLYENNTNFKSLIKNLENNPRLYELVYDLLMEGEDISYNADNPLIELGETYGVFHKCDGRLKIHNRVYEQRIYNYMASKIEISVNMGGYNAGRLFYRPDGMLDMEKVLLRFQAFLKEQYSKKDKGFLERNGRLLFLAFLKPIINGKGYDFKEVEISEEKRLDVVVTFLDQKYIIELKKWYGDKAHRDGLDQLIGYLERLDLENGYLIIYDGRKKTPATGKSETIAIGSRRIFAVWV